MPSPLKTYDLKRCVLIIGGYRIEGFGEDDAIGVELPSQRVESIIGADGQVTAARNNDNRVTVTLSLMETSRSVRDLMTLYRQQEAQGSILPLTFSMTDLNSGDQLNSAYTVFMAIPGPSKAKGPGVREFVIELPNGAAAGSMLLASSVAL